MLPDDVTRWVYLNTFDRVLFQIREYPQQLDILQYHRLFGLSH